MIDGQFTADIRLGDSAITAAKGVTLTVTLADSGYGSATSGFTAAPGTLTASATSSGQINNAAAGSLVSVESWIGGTQELAGSSSGPTFGFSTLNPYIYSGGPFTMFTQAVITLTGPVTTGPATANVASDVRVAAVPEPGSLVLLSAGLFLGAIVLRRQRKGAPAA